MTNQTLTTILNNGATVLAKSYKGETVAKTFANYTQANNAAAQSGGWVCQMGRPFFVRFDNAGA